MKGEEVLRQIAARRKAGNSFISWWRREEDWLDVELLDIYLQNVKPDEEIGGFNLLGMDEMWEMVRKVAGPRVERRRDGTEEAIAWKRKSGRQMICPFTPGIADQDI